MTFPEGTGIFAACDSPTGDEGLGGKPADGLAASAVAVIAAVPRRLDGTLAAKAWGLAIRPARPEIRVGTPGLDAVTPRDVGDGRQTGFGSYPNSLSLEAAIDTVLTALMAPLAAPPGSR